MTRIPPTMDEPDGALPVTGGPEQGPKSEAWRAAHDREIGAPEAYDHLMFAAHQFAYASKAPAGVHVLAWALERARAAEAAGWAAIFPTQTAKEGVKP